MGDLSMKHKKTDLVLDANAGYVGTATFIGTLGSHSERGSCMYCGVSKRLLLVL